ncbi:MAG: polysaccharide deacetylase family protein [Gammaproteobacteria bacterium]
MIGLLLVIVIGLLWFSLRYAWWRPNISDTQPRILMYHMVAPHREAARFNGLRVTPENFELQLGWLREHGWSSYTISELMAMGHQVPAKSVAITFDDGYQDNLTAALPLLEQYDFKATVYLVVDRMNNDWSVNRKAHHDEGELMREAKLNDEQVHQMLASGRIELASHSLTHPNLLDCDDNQLHKELAESRQQLEVKFSVPVKSFAYPFGLYRSDQVSVVDVCGYTSAVTTQEGINEALTENSLQLKRIKVSGKDSMRTFSQRMRTGQRGMLR